MMPQSKNKTQVSTKGQVTNYGNTTPRLPKQKLIRRVKKDLESGKTHIVRQKKEKKIRRTFAYFKVIEKERTLKISKFVIRQQFPLLYHKCFITGFRKKDGKHFCGFSCIWIVVA